MEVLRNVGACIRGVSGRRRVHANVLAWEPVRNEGAHAREQIQITTHLSTSNPTMNVGAPTRWETRVPAPSKWKLLAMHCAAESGWKGFKT